MADDEPEDGGGGTKNVVAPERVGGGGGGGGGGGNDIVANCDNGSSPAPTTKLLKFPDGGALSNCGMDVVLSWGRTAPYVVSLCLLLLFCCLRGVVALLLTEPDDMMFVRLCFHRITPTLSSCLSL